MLNLASIHLPPHFPQNVITAAPPKSILRDAANGEASAYSMDTLKSQKSLSSTSNRSFLSRTLSRRDGGTDSSTDARGPLGLNTLYDPSSPAIADLVFVHGLGGGSRSTWTKSGDRSLYWPQEWLPHDPGFQDVRIHSFGYDSNWDKESTLNLHDFAKSLLGSIQDCPLIPHGSDVSGFTPVSSGCHRTLNCVGPRYPTADMYNRLQSSLSATVWEDL